MAEATGSESKPKLQTKHDWYQTDAAVVITVLVKNLSDDQLKISFEDSKVQLNINVPEYEPCSLCFNLSHKINPEQCEYKITPSKIEIKLKKSEGIRWEKLEGDATKEPPKAIPASGPVSDLGHPPSYPTSKKGKDWSAVERQMKEQEAQEKPEGEEALQKLFQEIYGKGSDEVKKAMNKSYLESGGTVLSTNWKEIAGQKVEVKPPDGMEFKKWDS